MGARYKANAVQLTGIAVTVFGVIVIFYFDLSEVLGGWIIFLYIAVVGGTFSIVALRVKCPNCGYPILQRGRDMGYKYGFQSYVTLSFNNKCSNCGRNVDTLPNKRRNSDTSDTFL